MHVNVRTYPIRYEPGELLNSSSIHSVEGTEYFSQFQTGAKLALPREQLYRTIATELTVNGLYIERAFLHYEHGSEMFPIWSKVYNKDSAPVVIYKDAISALVNEWGDEKFKTARFFGEEMLGKVLYELSYDYSMEAESMWDEMCILSGIAGSLMNNNLMLPRKIVLEAPCKHPLWSSVHLPESVKRFYAWSDDGTYNEAKTLSSLCGSDLSYGTSYLKDEIRKRTEPDLGTDYFEFYSSRDGFPDYDYLTTKSYEAPEMSSRDVRKFLGMYRADRLAKLDNFLDMDDFEPLTDYDPPLLDFCTVIHEIPAFEYSFVYKLCQPGDGVKHQELEWITCVKPKNSAAISDSDVLNKLTDATQLWNPDIYEIDVAKNSDSEVLLVIKTMHSGDYLYYLDLTIAALLTNNLTYKH